MIGAPDSTLQSIQGRFPVVGVWQNGPIVERDGELRAVGASQTNHNLYPLQARPIQGVPHYMILNH